MPHSQRLAVKAKETLNRNTIIKSNASIRNQTGGHQDVPSGERVPATIEHFIHQISIVLHANTVNF